MLGVYRTIACIDKSSQKLDKMLLEKSSLSSILKGFLEQQIHLVTCSSVLSLKFFMFDMVTIAYPPRSRVMGSSRLQGPLGPFQFPRGSPQLPYTCFPRGDARTQNSHFS